MKQQEKEKFFDGDISWTKPQDKYLKVTSELRNIYEAKNHDYGDSFSKTYKELGLISAVTRITDKNNRLVKLATSESKVKDETIRDTLLDMANYCILTIMELDNDRL